MPTSRLAQVVFGLAALLAAVYLVGGIAGGLLFDWDQDGDDNDRAVWVVALVLGAALLILGMASASRSRSLAAVLMGVGAIVGAVVIFWSVLVPLAALALIVLSVMWARRADSPVERA